MTLCGLNGVLGEYIYWMKMKSESLLGLFGNFLNSPSIVIRTHHIEIYIASSGFFWWYQYLNNKFKSWNKTRLQLFYLWHVALIGDWFLSIPHLEEVVDNILVHNQILTQFFHLLNHLINNFKIFNSNKNDETVEWMREAVRKKWPNLRLCRNLGEGGQAKVGVSNKKSY